MRKILTFTVIICILWSLFSCGGETPPPLPDEEKSELEQIAEKLLYSYSGITIVCKTDFNTVTLTDTYNISYFEDSIMIDYEIESMLPFEFENGSYVIPDSDNGIKKDTGTVKLNSQGKVESGGDGKTDYSALARVRLDLNEEYFSRLTYSEISLKGTASNFSAIYTGFSGIPNSNVRITAEYNDVAFESLVFSYKTQSHANVTITYHFFE